jgi:ribosome biogenesis protein Tsr3
VETDSEDQKLVLHVRITIYHAAQDDPKKNTALRLKRRGIARIVSSARFLPKRAIVLNPFGEIAFSPADKERLEQFGLAALDCSWEHAQKVMGKPCKFWQAYQANNCRSHRGSLVHCWFQERG